MRYVKYIGGGVTVLVVFLFLLSSGIVLLKPHGSITDVKTTFEWVSPHDNVRLLVDDSLDFDNPLVDVPVRGSSFTLSSDLDFGKYYWRVVSNSGNSVTGQFVLDSMIRMDVEDDKLRNEGNTAVGIDGITGRAVLDVGEETDLREGENKVSQV